VRGNVRVISFLANSLKSDCTDPLIFRALADRRRAAISVVDATEQQLRILAKCRGGLSISFAENFLKIRDKSGDTVPFKFNSAQHYLHAKIEEQKARKGLGSHHRA